MNCTPVFEFNHDSTKKIVVNRGGTRSSKTYSLAQLCALWLMTGSIGSKLIPKGVWSTVRKHSTTLDKTVIRDFQEILENEGWYHLIKHDKTKKTYSYEGRIVEFFGADDQQKLRGSKRSILYCNEANELEYKQEFFQLLIRTEEKIFIDFNPDDEDIWINTELEQKRAFDKGDVEVIVSNYTHNTFLPQTLVDEIEYLQKTDPEFWRIYGLGEYGKISGLIIEDFKTVESIPEGAKFLGVGLDFGFTNDPTAAIKLYRKGDDLYLDEIIYSTGLTNVDIANELKANGITINDEVICDSAEPKSIQELYNLRINAKPAKKGKDSINIGINILKRFNIHITPRSTNLRKELRNYKWAVDKNGKTLNKPIDKWQHGIDAVRYVALLKLGVSNKGIYTIR